MRHPIPLVLTTLLLAAGCGGDSTGPQQGNGSLSATINGSSFTATIGVQATRTTNGGFTSIGIGGSDSQGNTLALGFLDNGAIVYPIGGIPNAANALVGEGAKLWAANVNVGSGTITVTTLTATRVAGTFSFIAPASPGNAATGTKTVTNGQFDVNF